MNLGSNIDKDACQEKCWLDDDCHVVEHEWSGAKRCIAYKGAGNGFEACWSGAECYLKMSTLITQALYITRPSHRKFSFVY